MPEERRISPAIIIPVGLGLGLIAVVGIAALAKAAPPEVFTCPYCGATFATEEELNYHIETEHPELPPPFAEFRIGDLVISPSEVYIGELVIVSCTVENIGTATGDYTVTLGGDFLAEQTVTLQPSESKIVSFEVVPDAPKVYQVMIDGLTGTFTAIGELSCSRLGWQLHSKIGIWEDRASFMISTKGRFDGESFITYVNAAGMIECTRAYERFQPKRPFKGFEADTKVYENTSICERLHTEVYAEVYAKQPLASLPAGYIGENAACEYNLYRVMFHLVAKKGLEVRLCYHGELNGYPLDWCGENIIMPRDEYAILFETSTVAPPKEWRRVEFWVECLTEEGWIKGTNSLYVFATHMPVFI